MGQPREEEWSLISSITSTNFQKLIFAVPHLAWDSYFNNPCWIPFDDTICGLVDRLRRSGYNHTMEVELRGDIVKMGEVARSHEFLPRFKEKGRVKVVEVSSGRLWGT